MKTILTVIVVVFVVGVLANELLPNLSAPNSSTRLVPNYSVSNQVIQIPNPVQKPSNADGQFEFLNISMSDVENSMYHMTYVIGEVKNISGSNQGTTIFTISAYNSNDKLIAVDTIAISNTINNGTSSFSVYLKCLRSEIASYKIDLE